VTNINQWKNTKEKKTSASFLQLNNQPNCVTSSSCLEARSFLQASNATVFNRLVHFGAFLGRFLLALIR
jgi:hypothetical protein